MNATMSPKTRLEDWHDRRNRLLSLGSEAPHVVVQIKLLDYLIARYCESEVAHLPARFSLPRKLYWNDRRIVVHHHLGRGQVAGVADKLDAKVRVSQVLQRMSSTDPREGEGFVPAYSADTHRRPLRSYTLNIKLKLGWNADRQIRKQLAKHPILTEKCLAHLFARLTDTTREDANALEFFMQCQNQNILDWTARAWRERLANEKSRVEVTRALEARLAHPDNRTLAAEKIREQLADDVASVRLAAARLLSQLGDLDDVGLLSDLLSLPSSGDEDPAEREVIANAIKTLVHCPSE